MDWFDFLTDYMFSLVVYKEDAAILTDNGIALLLT